MHPYVYTYNLLHSLGKEEGRQGTCGGGRVTAPHESTWILYPRTERYVKQARRVYVALLLVISLRSSTLRALRFVLSYVVILYRWTDNGTLAFLFLYFLLILYNILTICVHVWAKKPHESACSPSFHESSCFYGAQANAYAAVPPTTFLPLLVRILFACPLFHKPMSSLIPIYGDPNISTFSNFISGMRCFSEWNNFAVQNHYFIPSGFLVSIY